MRSFSAARLALIFLLICISCGAAFIFLKPPSASNGVAQAAVYRVGLEDYYPPMAFTDENGAHTGFDHDIAEALCQQMNAQCEFVITSFDDMLVKMNSGELDFMVAGLAALEERKPFMEFTAPYYRSRTIYIGKTDQEISADGLRGKTMGAQGATIQLERLTEVWADVANIVSGSHEEVINGLVQGSIDVVLADALACYDFLKSEEGRHVDIIGEPLEIDSVISLSRIGVRKGKLDLVEALDKAIIALRVGGEYDRITRKYFAFSIY